MKLKQISIFIENRSGRLATITHMLGEAGINIRAMSLADTSDFGIFRVIVNDTEKAIQALKEAGFTISLSDVIAVKIADYPGELGKLLAALDQSDLNVEYMYAFVQKSDEFAVVIFSFEDLDQAIHSIQTSGYTILSNQDVAEI
jgi:hypothetical protein